MAFYIDLFSPETYAAFTNSTLRISGFRKRQWNMASRIQQGDGLICYVTRLSRWVGYLEVINGPFENSTPIFVDEDDPFVVRFNVEPPIWLDLDKSIPIHDDEVWRALSFTRELHADSLAWTGKVRSSPRSFGRKLHIPALRRPGRDRAAKTSQSNFRSCSRRLCRGGGVKVSCRRMRK